VGHRNGCLDCPGRDGGDRIPSLRKQSILGIRRAFRAPAAASTGEMQRNLHCALPCLLAEEPVIWHRACAHDLSEADLVLRW